MQVLIWYKAAGAAFHIRCSSLNGMSCSNVFQVHQKQKRPQSIYISYLYQIHDMWHGVQQSQANYTHTHVFCFSKAKNLPVHSVLWARHFHHKLPMEKSHSAKSRLKTSQKEAPLLPSKVSQRFKRSIVGLPTISWWHIHGGHSFGVENFFRHLINFTQKKIKFVNKCLFPQNYGNLRDSCWLPHRNLAPLFSHLHTNETNGSSFKVETQQWHQQIYPKWFAASNIYMKHRGS